MTGTDELKTGDGKGCLTPDQEKLQSAKGIVRDYHESLALEHAPDEEKLKTALGKHYTENVKWHGVHPFNVLDTPDDVATKFWGPLVRSFGGLQRRDDVMLAGFNACSEAGGSDKADDIWVHTSGHLLGLFDKPWLGIPPTGRLCFVRYCEFSKVDLSTRKITMACVHVDILSVMRDAGVYPLPAPTGAHLNPTPGPRTHDGILQEPQDAKETQKTLELLDAMLDGLGKFNVAAAKSGNKDQGCPPSALAPHWHSDMLWFGPTGIGATGLTIERYQRQHQMPFRKNLYCKSFGGHVSKIAEGSYEAWFGWPNLSNKASGGFLGLPSCDRAAEMRVVDVYRRGGDKIAENWIFIDVPHYLLTRGLDVLGRMEELRRLGD